MKKIVQRYDWGEQPATANCSYVLVEDPLGSDNRAKWAVCIWNRDTNGMGNSEYFGEGQFPEAQATLEEKVKQYERLYGESYPGNWVTA